MTRDYEHPFFRPLWRRVAIVAVCLAWSGFEFANGSSGWGIAVLGFAAYGAWQFFYLHSPPPEPGDPAEPENKE